MSLAEGRSTAARSVSGHPRTALVLGAFFALATIISAAAALSLLAPGTRLDAIWAAKPLEREQLLSLHAPVWLGFFVLAIAMAFASFGSFSRRRWGWQLAVAIFALNGAADAARIPSGGLWEGLFGVAVTVAILWWLTRADVRQLFRTLP